MKLILIMMVAGLLAGGCASYKIMDGEGKILSQGESFGLMRTITVTEKYKDGKLTDRSISTDSNTKDVLMGLNEFIDTAVDTASKLKP